MNFSGLAMPKPSSQADKCTQVVHDSRPKVEENGRKAVFLNLQNDEVRIIRVDNCLITGSSRRADYIMSRPGLVDVIVELKGKDIFHARDQILATLPVWLSNPPFSSKIVGLIICSKSPASSSELQVMISKARKAGLTLIVEKNGKREYDFVVLNCQ
jgi:hypothetical protein